MLRKPMRQAFLILPREALPGVLRELYVVWRIGIDKVVRLELDGLEIAASKIPVGQEGLVFREIVLVPDIGIAAVGNVEFALAVEPAKAVIASAIQIVEKRGRFPAALFSFSN